MGSKAIIAIGVVLTLGALIIVALSVGYGTNQYLFQDGSLPLTGNWNTGGYEITLGEDMNASGNYILEFPLESWIHLDFSQGVTDVHISSIPSGIHSQDRRFLMLHVSVNIPPGVGKTVTVTVTDGTDSLEILITGDVDTSEHDDSTPFNLDVSAETLDLTYSQTAGGGSTSGCVMLHWYYKENE